MTETFRPPYEPNRLVRVARGIGNFIKDLVHSDFSTPGEGELRARAYNPADGMAATLLQQAENHQAQIRGEAPRDVSQL